MFAVGTLIGLVVGITLTALVYHNNKAKADAAVEAGTAAVEKAVDGVKK